MTKKPYSSKDVIKKPWLEENKKENNNDSKTISKIVNSKIEESLKDFWKLNHKQRNEILDSEDFFEQFWAFFKKEHPMLLDEIDSKEKLTVYVKSIEKMWFSLKNIIENNKTLHKEFSETLDEKTTITDSLKQLQQFCKKPENKMPSNIFDNFANEVEIETNPNIEITQNTKITKIWELWKFRKIFLEDKEIKLKTYQESDIENILYPQYLPTERLLISATIKKIKTKLPKELHSNFDLDFPIPINIHSRFQNLKDFKQEWVIFLEWNKWQIDQELAKELDKINITNWDIFKEFQFEWENIDISWWFSGQTKRFRMMFNQIATRQLFEKSKEKWAYVEYHLQQIWNEFKSFPPYFNEITNIYPYNHENVINQQAKHKEEYNKQEKILTEKEKDLWKTNISDKQKEIIRKEIFEIKEKINLIKRKAYADYIKTKDSKLWESINQLVENQFDISKLLQNQQQTILNTLVHSKLEDSIKNNIPNILWAEENEYQDFIKNIFDLNQKDITIKTQYQDIPIHFLEKNFLWWPTNEIPGFWTWEKAINNQKNLPLNLKIQVTEQNSVFFENNILFEGLFEKFNSKNWLKTLNDSYKIRIKNKEGKSIEWYLSKYPPTTYSEDNSKISKDWWFLYSHPINRPEDAREIITWDWKPNWDPVVILEENETNYELDILSKELNLNWEWISALLFSQVLWKYNEKNDLSKEHEQIIAEKFGKIDKNKVYKDTIDKYMDIIKDEPEKKPEEIEKEKTNEEKNKKEFLYEWQNLQGYQEKEHEKNSDEKTYWFKKWAKLLIRGPESWFPPTGVFQYFTAEVIEIKNNEFEIQFKWSEQSLGNYEWKKYKFPLSKEGIKKIKDTFDDQLYKLPNKNICENINDLLPAMKEASIDWIKPNESFDGTKRDGNNFNISIGEESNEQVSHFGLVETKPWEDWWKESKNADMYKIQHEPSKKKFKLTYNDEKKTVIYLDYPNFILFVANRKLQPQTEESAKKINIEASDWPTLKEPKKRKAYSFGSIIWLFKNFGKKIWDGLKKYEEDQVEELTDNIFYHWKLFNKLASIMPTQKLQEAFGNAWSEYVTQRDSKVWGKIEKYQKFFLSDPDFGSKYMRDRHIKPYLDWTKKFKDHHQAAAMLLVTIEKWKWPYSRNSDRAGKWMWVKSLFWEAHQQRYLTMKKKLERELQQWYKSYGQVWADDLQNEILKLEMKYITHCIDWRQLRVSDDDVARLEWMYSKKFAWELEWKSNDFFSKSVSESSKEKSYSFELARFEYFRLLADRPQQAIPCLRQMACKAVTPTQWEAFESGVLTWMLSWIFYNITQEDKDFIQKICRTIGFLPGMLIKDPNHHYKIEKFIKIVTNEEIVWSDNGKMEVTYDSNKAWFWKWKDLGQYKSVCSYNDWFNKRFTSNGRLKKITEFAAMKWKNYQWKTLVELLNDPQTWTETKEILAEIESTSLEKGEQVDTDVKMNWYGLSRNILAKSQSLIWEITNFQDREFKSKDKDEKQWIQSARKAIANDIPRKKLSNENQVISIIKKFMNRFEEKGFNIEEKKFFIRALKTIKEEEKKGNKEGSDEILWYLVVWKVIESSWSNQAPDELINWLEAFKEFFKNNIDTVLKSNTIEKSMWSIYTSELEKKPFKIGKWSEFVELKKNRFLPPGNKEEAKIRKEKQILYNTPNYYINDKIYTLAENIQRRNYIPNMFDKYFSFEDKKTTNQKLHEVLDPKTTVKVKNPEAIEKATRKISWEIQEESIDEYQERLNQMAEAEAESDWYNDYY